MNRVLVAFVGLMIVLGACSTQRMICPAYQSSFIYDKEALRKKFSYFENDSIPRIFTASTSKSRYLVAVPESYRKKLRSLQTVEMKPIYPEIPDSLKAEQDFSLAERDVVVDSAALNQPKQGLEPTDSAYAITKTKEKYNVDQDNYMWYFRDALVLPDVRAAMQEKKEAIEEKAGKKGLFSGLKNLFKKKPKDSTAVNSPVLDQSDESDSSAVAKPKKVKGLLKKKAKTDKKEKPKDEKKKDPVKKEDEDDGF